MTSPPPSLYWPKRSKAQAAAWLLPVVLAACAPDLGALPKPNPVQDYATKASFSAPEAGWPSADWWKAYGDPELDKLMAEALAGAPDLRIAEARLREAEASQQQTGAKLWPDLT